MLHEPGRESKPVASGTHRENKLVASRTGRANKLFASGMRREQRPLFTNLIKINKPN